MTISNLTIIDGKHATLDDLKLFSIVPFFIPWYRSSESNKVFPIILNEITDLNASQRSSAKILGNNPFFDHTDIEYIVARNGDVPVGRIAAFVDERYNNEHSESTGWIGMFECVENRVIADMLLLEAAAVLKEKGCDKVIGPAKFNANGEVGLLVDGFNYKPYFMEGYNAPYYQAFFDTFGFMKENDWYSVQVSDINGEKLLDYMSRIERIRQKLITSSRGMGQIIRDTHIRNARFADFADEIKIIKSLYNSEWGKGNHPQFVSMTDPEFNALATGIKLIALEELILLAEHKGNPVGVAVTVPNINEVIDSFDRQRSNYQPSPHILSPGDIYRDISILTEIKKKLRSKSFETARVLILGVAESYRSAMIDASLYNETFKRATQMGIGAASFSEMADINGDILRPLVSMGDIAMTWRVYSLGI